MGYNNIASFTAVSASDITNTSSTQVKAAVTGLKIYVKSIMVSNMNATVATRVDILAGSTVIWTGPAAAAGGGYQVTFDGLGIPCAAATAINAQCGTTSATVRVSIYGYIGN